MLDALKVIFLPWLVIAERDWLIHVQYSELILRCDLLGIEREENDSFRSQLAELRAEIATLKNDANGKVARGKGGRFVSVKG